MKSRLPSTINSFRKILSPRFIFAVAMFVISPFLLLFLINIFISTANTVPFSVQEFYLSRNSEKPNLYIRIQNTSFRDEQLWAYLKLDDKLNKVKKQIDIGNLGTVQAKTKKEFILAWDNNWEGSGIGDINLTIKNKEGIIAEKSIYLVVIPSSLASVEMFTFLASSFAGAGFIISRFT